MKQNILLTLEENIYKKKMLEKVGISEGFERILEGRNENLY